MKQLGKIGVLLISFFVLSAFFWFINLQLYESNRIGGFGLLFTIGFSWFISYSKWANDNIWNTKTSNPTNESIDPINPNDDNQKVLDNIQNVLSTSDDNSALQKIEELKRQIESLEQAIKNNNSNSETESPELSAEELTEEKDYGEYWKNSNRDYSVWAAVLVLLIICFIMIIANN